MIQPGKDDSSTLLLRPATGTKSTSHGPTHSHHKVTSSSEKELNKKSDKEVNVQIFKTAEEMKSVERNLSHLKQQLARNLSRDKKMSDSVKAKIRDQEKYLNQLKTSSQTLETHRDRRSAHKKLSMF
ncbi:hypothetical protein Btru_062319 [Bulinus truncatus]|nr:hypothetical protein Btru_062319 [Bulinus truncatus]